MKQEHIEACEKKEEATEQTARNTEFGRKVENFILSGPSLLITVLLYCLLFYVLYKTKIVEWVRGIQI